MKVTTPPAIPSFLLIQPLKSLKILRNWLTCRFQYWPIRSLKLPSLCYRGSSSRSQFCFHPVPGNFFFPHTECCCFKAQTAFTPCFKCPAASESTSCLLCPSDQGPCDLPWKAWSHDTPPTTASWGFNLIFCLFQEKPCTLQPMAFTCVISCLGF